MKWYDRVTVSDGVWDIQFGFIRNIFKMHIELRSIHSHTLARVLDIETLFQEFTTKE